MKVFIISSKRVPTVSKREPKGTKRETTGAKSEPKGSHGEAKVSHSEAQGRQKWAKGRPGCIEKSSCGKGREDGTIMRTIVSHPSIDSYSFLTFRKDTNRKLRKNEKMKVRSVHWFQLFEHLKVAKKGKHTGTSNGTFGEPFSIQIRWTNRCGNRCPQNHENHRTMMRTQTRVSIAFGIASHESTSFPKKVHVR